MLDRAASVCSVLGRLGTARYWQYIDPLDNLSTSEEYLSPHRSRRVNLGGKAEFVYACVLAYIYLSFSQ